MRLYVFKKNLFTSYFTAKVRKLKYLTHELILKVKYRLLSKMFQTQFRLILT